jgi:hypothetical protein
MKFMIDEKFDLVNPTSISDVFLNTMKQDAI